MGKRLTISLNENVYDWLHGVVGRGHISQFIESLVHSYVVTDGLDQAYREMAQDARRESDALAWAEATTIDTAKAMGRGQAL